MLSVVGSGDSFYGLRQMIFIFRNQRDGWRILQMDPNARVPIVNPAPRIGLPPWPSVVPSPSSCLRVTDHILPPVLSAFYHRIFDERTEPPPPLAGASSILPTVRYSLAGPSVRKLPGGVKARPIQPLLSRAQYWNPSGEGNWSVSNLTFANKFRGEQPFGNEHHSAWVCSLIDGASGLLCPQAPFPSVHGEPSCSTTEEEGRATERKRPSSKPNPFLLGAIAVTWMR